MGQPARPVRYLWVVISPTHLSQRPVPHSTSQAPRDCPVVAREPPRCLLLLRLLPPNPGESCSG